MALDTKGQMASQVTLSSGLDPYKLKLCLSVC